MFTGLITSIGEVRQISHSGPDMRLSISPTPAYENLILGESIAVNGTCLTVESHTSTTFSAYASEESLKVTTLGELKPGSKVNLERALAVGDRLGGHIVSGHVDGIATVESISQEGLSQKIRITFPNEFSGQVIPKGSVTLDGISLTINECGNGYLYVNIIPESQKATTIQHWVKGKKINFETDVIGKYVQHMLFPKSAETSRSTGITLNFLRENGF